MKNNFEKLILLEFMVNKVVFYEREYNFDKAFLARLQETRVQIKFKGSYILEIVEDDNSRVECNEKGHRTVHFGSGKSCLLSVSQLKANSNCDASLCISRKTPEGEAREYFTLGEATVNMEPVFKVLKNTSKCVPAVRSMKGEFDIRDGQCNKAGLIELFVRATDLGKNIVTMFQLGAGESSFYFKGTEPQATDEDVEDEEDSTCSVCKESKYDFGDPCRPVAQRQRVSAVASQGPRDPCFPYKEGTTYSQPQPQSSPWTAQPGYPPQFQPGFPPGPPQFAPGMVPMGGQRLTGQFPPGQVVPQARLSAPIPYQQYRDEDYENLDGDYKEISAEVNGYEVKIKLLRRPKKVAAE